MKLKRLFVELLVLVLLVSVAGCTDSDIEDVEQEVVNEIEQQAQDENANEESEEVEQEETESELDAVEIFDQSLRFSRGTWEGNVYTNTFLGMTMTIPEEWQVATDEEMASMFGLATDFMQDIDDQMSMDLNMDELKDLYIPAFYAYKPIENEVRVPSVNATMVRVLDDVVDYNELAEMNREVFEEMFAQYGEVIVDAVGEVEIGGQKMSLITCRLVNEEIQLNQYQEVYQFVKEGFLTTVTLGQFDDSTTIEDIVSTITFE